MSEGSRSTLPLPPSLPSQDMQNDGEGVCFLTQDWCVLTLFSPSLPPSLPPSSPP